MRNFKIKDWLDERVVVAHRNADVRKINGFLFVLEIIPGEEKVKTLKKISCFQ